MHKPKRLLAGLAAFFLLVIPPAVVLWKVDQVDQAIQEQAGPASITHEIVMPDGQPASITTPQGMTESDAAWLARHALKVRAALEE